MFMKQYIHRLPADYDMERIATRAAALGPDWDRTPGLGFKAFIARRRGMHGAVGNSYSSLYLWLNDEAVIDFITGERFRNVVAGFGRPRIETWLPFHIHLGPANTARSVYREDIVIEADADLAAVKRREGERNHAAVRKADAFAAVTAVDLSTWRLTRFVLSADAAHKPERGTAYEILHLAKPGIPALFAAA